TWPVQRLVRICGLAVGNCWRCLVWGGRGGGRASWLGLGSRGAGVGVAEVGVVRAGRVIERAGLRVGGGEGDRRGGARGAGRGGGAGAWGFGAGGWAGGGGGFGADEVGGGKPGPELLADHVWGPRAEDRADRGAGVGDGGLVLLDGGFRAGPAQGVGRRQRAGG